MNTRIKIITTLFVIMYGLSSGVSANAGLLNWITGQKTEWTFQNVYKGVVGQADQSESSAVQETVALESEKLITPVKTRSVVVKQQYVVTATAYSSTVDQTDDTPFITALGTHVRDGIVATNFLPFGTVIRIPDIYGDKEFVVEDRMNKRYWHWVDIWFSERQMAKEFGVKQIRIEIIS